jgi:rod shape-determining protein MreC
MFRLLERYRTAIVIFFAITLPVFVYRANAIEPANANPVDRVLLAATAPLKSAMSWAIGSVSDLWYSYIDVVRARGENGQLRRRLIKAERARDEAEALVTENAHLRGLLKIKEPNPQVTFLAATVIAAGTSPLARTIEIDKGALEGVGRGMVVVSDEGLVGLVLRVAWTSSEVMLIADEKFTASVTVVRSRARGRIKGNGLAPGFGLELGEVLRVDDAKAGDRVATSGLGGVFPKGIPIGEVTLVRTPTGAQHRIADVEPYVDFARLEHVMVLVAAPKDEPLVTPEPLRPATLRSGVAIRAITAPDAGARDGGKKRAGAAKGLDGGRGGKAVDAALAEEEEEEEEAPDSGGAADAGVFPIDTPDAGLEPGADPGIGMDLVDQPETSEKDQSTPRALDAGATAEPPAPSPDAGTSGH